VAGAAVLWWSATPVLALAAAASAAAAPSVAERRRGRSARRVAATAWPRLLDDLRVRTGALGRPIPQALLEVGARGPIELRPAFAEAAREWSLSTDLARMLHVLKDHLADPTADAVCETLLVAHEVGGDLDGRLAALAEDRRTDLRHRAEAEARQAGARVARWFVLVVPAGMALAGSRLGDGTEAFTSPGAHVATGVAVAMVAVCWWWAGRIMALPEQPRVFDR
jgi:tight adherence protein B